MFDVFRKNSTIDVGEESREMSENGQNWKTLYKIGGIASIIYLVYSLVTMVLMFTIGGQPASAQEAFAMLAENRLVGLLRLDMLTIFIVPLYYLIFLGTYAALKKTNGAVVLLATALTFVGVTLFLATPSVFAWLTLSDKFAAATSEAQKTLLLAAGEAILASDMWHSSSALIGGILLQTGALLVSLIMLRSQSFSKPTAWVGIVTHGLDLAHVLIIPLVPAVGVAIMFVAGPLYLVWFPFLARDFFRLCRE